MQEAQAYKQKKGMLGKKKKGANLQPLLMFEAILPEAIGIEGDSRNCLSSW